MFIMIRFSLVDDLLHLHIQWILGIVVEQYLLITRWSNKNIDLVTSRFRRLPQILPVLLVLLGSKLEERHEFVILTLKLLRL